jgi:hypothetical protein
MTLFSVLVTGLGILLTLGMTLLSVAALRKERPVALMAPLLSLCLSGMTLLSFWALSGARLRWALAGLCFAIGLLVGLVRGATIGMRRRAGRVYARQPWLPLLSWGGSLALAQVSSGLGSALWACLGLIPLVVSTGTQVGLHGTLCVRRLLIRAA